MKACVTGATGFVGTHVARVLLAQGATVRVLARPDSDRRNLEGLDVEIVQGDLLQPDTLNDLVAGCDELYHMAAYYSTRPEDAPMMYQVNVQGTKNIMRAALAHNITRVVHTSTIGTIGRTSDGSLPTEATAFNQWDRASDYAKSKFLGESAAIEMVRQGLPVTVVHPVAPVGPHDYKPTSTGQRLVDYLNGKRPSLAPGGINFCGVRDIAQGHVLAARVGKVGEQYILGHGYGNLTTDQFIALMEQASGKTLPAPHYRNPLRWLQAQLIAQRPPAPAGYQPDALTCDPSKAIDQLGMPQTPLVEAFAEAVAWFVKQGYVRTP